MLKHFIYSSSSKPATSPLCSPYYRYSSELSSFFCILSFLVIATSIDQTFYSATHYLAAVWLDSRHGPNRESWRKLWRMFGRKSWRELWRVFSRESWRESWRESRRKSWRVFGRKSWRESWRVLLVLWHHDYLSKLIHLLFESFKYVRLRKQLLSNDSKSRSS